MRLGQIKWRNEVTAAIFEGDVARPIPNYTLYELICRSEAEKTPLPELAAQHASTHREELAPILPLQPREVWGCGGTYTEAAGRPAVFLKGTARVCVGPGQAVGIRPDSRLTVPEPELAVVLGKKGRILGYTIANDVTARDIASEDPLFLAQSKTFAGCCALGPCVLTPDELGDPYALELRLDITRGVRTVFSGSASTARLNRTVETLIEFLLRANPVPSGSVLLTGSGVDVPPEAALAPEDLVHITMAPVGVLSNPVVRL